MGWTQGPPHAPVLPQVHLPLVDVVEVCHRRRFEGEAQHPEVMLAGLYHRQEAQEVVVGEEGRAEELRGAVHQQKGPVRLFVVEAHATNHSVVTHADEQTPPAAVQEGAAVLPCITAENLIQVIN